MSASKKFRERYGLSQPDLADYLSVSLSLLKQVETNARMLPTGALLKMNAFALYEAKEEADSTTYDTGTTTEHHKKLNSAARRAAIQLYTAQQQLEKILKKYEQAQQLLALCKHLLAQNPTDELDKLWLERQQLLARQRLKMYRPEEQALLQWKIACLEFAVNKGAELMKAGT